MKSCSVIPSLALIPYSKFSGILRKPSYYYEDNNNRQVDHKMWKVTRQGTRGRGIAGIHEREAESSRNSKGDI